MTNPLDRFAAQLLELKLIRSDQLRIAYHTPQTASRPVHLVENLVELGFAPAATLYPALAEFLGVTWQGQPLSEFAPDPTALALCPAEQAQRWHIMPLNYRLPHPAQTMQGELRVLAADPDLLAVRDGLHALLPPALKVVWHLGQRAEISQLLAQYYAGRVPFLTVLQDLATAGANPNNAANPNTNNSPAVRLVTAMLEEAAAQGASDIHLEPEAGFVRLRLRLDGCLQQIAVIPQTWWAGIVVRLKVLAGMNIAETRAAQDGQFSVSCLGRKLDLRVASLPTLHGENLVLRLLEQDKGIVPLPALGLPPAQVASLRQLVQRPEGLLVVTGPTGSGKTTSLYSMLHTLDAEQLNIMTLEDPVEYPLPRLRQTSLAEAVKLDFAAGIRALLRQDPDVILVGEIRDPETAQMTLRAAMTGHRVFSTLHSNSALMALPRLFELGIAPAALVGTLSGLMAQRLLRRLCVHCREAEASLYRAVGCAACHGTGYRGRLAVMEIIVCDAAFAALLAQGASLPTLAAHLTQQGFVPLATAAYDYVQRGITSAAEYQRVFGAAAENSIKTR